MGFTKLDNELPAMFRISTEDFLGNVDNWLHARAKARALQLRVTIRGVPLACVWGDPLTPSPLGRLGQRCQD